MKAIQDSNQKETSGSEKSEVIEIAAPLVIMFEAGDKVICHLYPSQMASGYEAYGLLICDLARHVARAFHVSEDEVWEWVEKERYHPTTEIITPN